MEAFAAGRIVTTHAQARKRACRVDGLAQTRPFAAADLLEHGGRWLRHAQAEPNEAATVAAWALALRGSLEPEQRSVAMLASVHLPGVGIDALGLHSPLTAAGSSYAAAGDCALLHVPLLQAIALAVSCGHMQLLLRSSRYRWYTCVRNTFTVVDVSNQPSRANLVAGLLLARVPARSARVVRSACCSACRRHLRMWGVKRCALQLLCR